MRRIALSVIFAFTLGSSEGKLSGVDIQDSRISKRPASRLLDLEEDGDDQAPSQASQRVKSSPSLRKSLPPKWDASSELEDGFSSPQDSSAPRLLDATDNTSRDLCDIIDEQESINGTADDQDRCESRCPADLIMSLFPQPAQTCGDTQSKTLAFLQKFRDFPGFGTMYDYIDWSATLYGFFAPSYFPFMWSQTGANAAKGVCKDLLGLQDAAKYCFFQTPRISIAPKLGSLELLPMGIQMCIAYQATWPPTVAFSFAGVAFPIGPWSIGFLGVMASFNGCAERELDSFVDMDGEVQRGIIMRPHAGVAADVSYGVQLPWFSFGVAGTAELYIDLDSNYDGTLLSPSQVIMAMFKQTCTQGANDGRDFQVMLYAKLELAMVVGNLLTIKFPMELYLQLLVDSKPSGTDVYMTFGLTSISSLASIFGEKYKWRVQDTGIEKRICEGLSRITGIRKKYNPFCKDDFALWVNADYANLYISLGSSGVAVQVAVGTAWSATLKKVHNGWQMCLNNKCHIRSCFLDDDCTEPGYSCYNVCSPWNPICKPRFVCQRELVGCLCGVVPFRYYKKDVWTQETCNNGCEMDVLWQASAAKECRGRGGSNHCIEKVVTNTQPKSYCDGADLGRRLKTGLLDSDHECFPTQVTFNACVNGTCPSSMGPADCIQGMCRCREGHCPSKDMSMCIDAEHSRSTPLPESEKAKPGKIINFEKEPGYTSMHPSSARNLDTAPPHSFVHSRNYSASVDKPPPSGRSLLLGIQAARSKTCSCGLPATNDRDSNFPRGQKPTAVTPAPTTTIAPPQIETKITTGHVSMIMDAPEEFTSHPEANAIMAYALRMTVQETTDEMVYQQYVGIKSLTRTRRLFEGFRRLVQSSGEVLVKYTVQFPYNATTEINTNSISEATLRAETERGAQENGMLIRVGTVTIHEPNTWIELTSSEGATGDTLESVAEGLSSGTAIGILTGICIASVVTGFLVYNFCRCKCQRRKVPPELDVTKAASTSFVALCDVPVRESLTSLETARTLKKGEAVVAAGPTQIVHGVVMLPIQPGGAVEMKYVIAKVAEATPEQHLRAVAADMYSTNAYSQQGYYGAQPTCGAQLTNPQNYCHEPSSAAMAVQHQLYGQQPSIQQPVYGNQLTAPEDYCTVAAASPQQYGQQQAYGQQLTTVQQPSYGMQLTVPEQHTHQLSSAVTAASPRHYDQQPTCAQQPGYSQLPAPEVYGHQPSSAATAPGQDHGQQLPPEEFGHQASCAVVASSPRPYVQQPTSGQQQRYGNQLTPPEDVCVVAAASPRHYGQQQGYGQQPAHGQQTQQPTSLQVDGHHSGGRFDSHQTKSDGSYGSQPASQPSYGSQDAVGGPQPGGKKGKKANGHAHHGHPQAYNPQSYQVPHAAKHGEKPRSVKKHDSAHSQGSGHGHDSAKKHDSAHSQGSGHGHGHGHGPVAKARPGKSPRPCSPRPRHQQPSLQPDHQHSPQPEHQRRDSGCPAKLAPAPLTKPPSYVPDFPPRVPGNDAMSPLQQQNFGAPAGAQSSGGGFGVDFKPDLPAEIPRPKATSSSWPAATGMPAHAGKQAAAQGHSLADWRAAYQPPQQEASPLGCLAAPPSSWPAASGDTWDAVVSPRPMGDMAMKAVESSNGADFAPTKAFCAGKHE